jgi:nucleoside diphosphate kinase
MKLTKYNKEVFVKAVMADIPDPDFNKTKDAIQTAVVNGMSSEASALYSIKPKALKHDTVYDVIPRYRGVTIAVGDADYLKIIKPWQEIFYARQDAESKLLDAIKGITTLKRLQETFPELVKYMPSEDTKTSNLPALNNVMVDLVKIGWKSNANK